MGPDIPWRLPILGTFDWAAHWEHSPAQNNGEHLGWAMGVASSSVHPNVRAATLEFERSLQGAQAQFGGAHALAFDRMGRCHGAASARLRPGVG